MRTVVFLIAILVCNGLRAQEITDRYKIYGGPYVSIDGVRPIGYSVSDGDITVVIEEITTHSIELKIHNKGSKVAEVNFEESYFVSGGESGKAIPGETMGFEVNQIIQPRKVAPDSWVKIGLYSKTSHDRNQSTPIFSDSRAKMKFNNGSERDHVYLNIVVDIIEGKFDHKFDFTVVSKGEFKNLSKKGDKIF